MNKGNKTQTNKSLKFELIYKIPNDYEDNWEYDEESPLFFLYLTPCQYDNQFKTGDDIDVEDYPFQTYQFINGQVSVGVKLLFIDVMRFFGGFKTEHDQPEHILSCRREIDCIDLLN